MNELLRPASTESLHDWQEWLNHLLELEQTPIVRHEIGMARDMVDWKRHHHQDPDKHIRHAWEPVPA